MEKLYRKLPNGRYEATGYDIDKLNDGIWLVQTNPISKSITSMVWRVGEIKKPADIVTHASLQAMENELTMFLYKLTQEDSSEYQELKQMYGNWVRGPLQIGNVSCSELVSIILRQIAIKIDLK